MQSSVILLVLLGLIAVAYHFGRKRAVAGGHTQIKTLHSLPSCYGFYAALWAGVPALLLLGLWSGLQDTITTALVKYESSSDHERDLVRSVGRAGPVVLAFCRFLAPFPFPGSNNSAVSAAIVLPQLLELICDLYDDTEGFLERTDDPQLWYNRGYANGLIHALGCLGYAGHVVGALDPDPEDLTVHQELLSWGKVRPIVTVGKWGRRKPTKSWR